MVLDNRLRIIGGKWRGRKISFPERDGLRPTPDRMRETLFNWLRDDLEGAFCLDLFSGSGALGFEAASRGARRVVMVEKDPVAYASMEANRDRFTSTETELVKADFAGFLQGKPEAFSLVFLDPPFSSEYLKLACELLESRDWLVPNARIYLESGQDKLPLVPSHWILLKTAKAGHSHGFLLERMPWHADQKN